MDFLLPDDILEVVFSYLYIGDRVRLRLVCKSWNRILMQHHIPTAPEAPWEILSHDSYNKPESSLSEICFKSLSDQERIYRFGLPSCLDNNHGGGSVWCCGSSHGWLAIMVGVGMNPDIFFLWNPLTGATRKLPPLSTLSFFDDCLTIQDCTIFSSVIKRVEVFPIRSVEYVVAVLFKTRRGRRIALCTTQETEWTTMLFNAEAEIGYITNYEDIMFHASGASEPARKLLVLANENFPTETQRQTFLSKARFEISSTDCTVQVVPVLVPQDGSIMGYNAQIGCNILPATYKNWGLVESSITGQVLLVVVEFKYLSCNSRTGRLREDLTLSQITGISVSSEHDIAKEAIFLGGTGCISSPKVHGIVPDCIYFTSDSPIGISGRGERSEVNFFCIREHGQSFVSRNKLCRKSSIAIKYPCTSRTGWFTPQLFML